MRCKIKFSEEVKYARIKLLLTQEALAKELGVFYVTICRWEKESREPQIVSKACFTPSAKVKTLSLKSKIQDGRDRTKCFIICCSQT